MTDPLTPERLAELRRIASGEDWSPPEREDVAALIGEIDRLTAENEQLSDLDDAATRRTELQAERDRAVQRWHVEHKRAETLEAENAKLAGERDELARFLREAIAESGLPFAELQAADADKPTAPVVAAARRTRDRLTAWLDSALDATLPQGAPQRDAQPPRAVFAATEPPEGLSVAQRAAEGFEWEYGYQLMAIHADPKPLQGPMMIGRDPADILAVMRQQRETFPEATYALRRRRVGPWGTVEDERAELVDLSGELDDFGPEHTAELKRISGLDVPTGAPLSAPCGHAPYWLVLGEDGVGCMVCGPAKAEEIAPEDEGISSADVQAQIESDRYMAATVECPACDGCGLELDAEGESHGECLGCAGMGRVHPERPTCPDCGHPETNCACG